MNNGYCKITIDEQEIGLKFNVYCNVWMQEAIAEDKEGILTAKVIVEEKEETIPTLFWYAKLLYFAYKCNCILKQDKPILTYENFFDWVEVNSSGESNQLSELMEVWSGTNASKKMIEDAKKKVAQTETIGSELKTLNPSASENSESALGS